MKITDLMPIGTPKNGCATLQSRDDQTVRTIYWTSEVPDYERDRPKPPHRHYICNITEESVDVMEFPEPMCQALAEVLTEIFNNQENLEKLKPGSFNRVLHRAASAKDLKNVVTKDDCITALRAKSRLGKWL